MKRLIWIAIGALAACGQPIKQDAEQPAATEAPPANRAPPTPGPDAERAPANGDRGGEPPLDSASEKDKAHRLYDMMQYEQAMTLALTVLEESPDDVRMLRIVVSSACLLGDAGKARQYWDQLPTRDRKQLARRCERYGITFD